MDRRHYLIFFILIGVSAIVSFRIIKTLFPSDREIILRKIEKGRRAVEEEDIKAIVEILSPDYLDAWGHDYYRLLFFLRNNFQVYDDIRVFLPFRKVVMKKPFAQCSLFVRVLGRDINYGEELIYSSTLIISFLKENKRWSIISASE